MNIEIEKDEQILSLNDKLFKYRQKVQEVEELRKGGDNSQSVVSLLEKLNKAVSITLNLIEKRRSEIRESQEEIPNKEFKSGDYVFAKKPGFSSWYIAIVEQVVKGEEIENNEYAVKFIGEKPPVHNIVTPRTRSIKEYSLPRHLLRRGISVLAVYEQDQVYYRAVIDKMDDLGWLWVRFKGYSGVQRTKEQHIRLLATFGKELYGEEKKKIKKKKDDQSELTGKKRKRNESESDLRKKTNIEKKRKLDNLLSKRKKNWKSFLEKGAKKKMKGVTKKKKRKKKGTNVNTEYNFGIRKNENNQSTETINNDEQSKPPPKPIEDLQEINRKRKGAVMQRPMRKNQLAENALEEFQILKRAEMKEDHGRRRRHHDPRYDRRRRNNNNNRNYDDRGRNRNYDDHERDRFDDRRERGDYRGRDHDYRRQQQPQQEHQHNYERRREYYEEDERNNHSERRHRRYYEQQ